MASTSSVSHLSSQGKTMTNIQTNLGNLCARVIQIGQTVNSNLIQPLSQSYKNAKDAIDIYKKGLDSITDLANGYLQASDMSGKADALAKFDGDWDKFADEFNKKFNHGTIAGNILEEFARTHFGDKVFVSGSIVKNEASVILGGIASIEKNLQYFNIDANDPIGTAKRIKDSTEAILKAAKDIDGSLNNVFTRLTNELSVNATALLSLQSKLYGVISTTTGTIPQSVKDALTRTGDGIEVLNSAKILVSAFVSDLHGDITPATLAKLSANINTNWDTFAKNTNELFFQLSKGSQTNIFESFAKSHFGDNVFYAGSAIKQEMPGVLGGISEFQRAIGALGGSSRNSVEVAQKIKNGVEGIVKATETIASSLNKMVGIYTGRGNAANVKNVPVLDALSKLGDTKVMRSVDSVLKLGASGTSLTSNATSALNNLKSGNIKGAIDDAKGALKNGKEVVDEVRNFGKNKMGGLTANANGGGPTNPSTKKNEKENGDEQNDDQSLSQANSDSYVCSTATMKCTFGDKSAKLTVYPDRTVYLTGKPMANISDHVSMYNIAPFGKCRTTSYPPTGSATASNHGTLTPMPCVPGTISEWLQGKSDYIIKGKPALLKSSYCKCQWGGVITITNDGQTDTGDADLNKVALLSEEEMLKRQEEEELAENAKLDADAVLDGIQTALDLAGFAPGIGAVPDLLNAAISACRGNWAEAGLSVVAAVPGIGDAAAGIKLANRGVKLAKAAQKVEKTAEVAKKQEKFKNISKIEDKYERRAKLTKIAEDYKYTDISTDELKRAGISETDSQFFMKKVRYHRRNEISEVYTGSDVNLFTRESHLNCADVSSPIVERGVAPKGTKYYQFMEVDSNGNFVDPPGNYAIRKIDSATATPNGVGIANKGKKNGTTWTRELHEVEVQEDTKYIVTKARKTTDTWSDPSNPVKVSGGGTQVFLAKKPKGK